MTLAWKNIWRNPVRSMVVIMAIALGIWAAMFMTGFATGMAQSYIDNAIRTRISHLQLHHPEYLEDQEVQYSITSAQDVQTFINKQDGVEGFSLRTVVNGMVASTKSSRGVRIRGINPNDENAVTGLGDQVIDGEYFSGNRKNQILLSKRSAEKLGVKLRKKIILTFQDANLNITSAAFRVVGLYETGNNPFDEAHVFVLSKDLNRILQTNTEKKSEDTYHEGAILLSDATHLPLLQKALQSEVPGLKIENYKELAPDVQLYESLIGSLSYFYLIIIMLALVFGIINTMLMAVLERMKELGMLMAIGMNKVRVFFMIVLETMFLSLVGAPLGILLGALSVGYVGKYGLDLSAFSSTMKMYGLSEVVYFEIGQEVYWQVSIAVVITAILASIYPAIKAIRLKPVEALRKL